MSVCLLLAVMINCQSCASAYKTITYNEPPKSGDSLIIHEGILSRTAQKITYKKKGRKEAVITLSSPVMIAQADGKERWGFFQFPSIGRADDGSLIVSWRMAEDSQKAFGKKNGREARPMTSKDGGLTWEKLERDRFFLIQDYHFVLNDGNTIEISTPAAQEIQSYKTFTKPVSKSITTNGVQNFYAMEKLPADLQGAYLIYRKKDRKSNRFQATIKDPGLVRPSVDNVMPLSWVGNIKQLTDGALVAGVYPTFYMDEKGNVTPGGVSFYRSEDLGHSWKILGRIPFVADGIADKRGAIVFEEPVFDILHDGCFLCIMRTGSGSPMYRTFSQDQGRTWSKPEPFTPNGVKPRLMTLKNGVMVLASGRPGVQLRFCFDGEGVNWTDPIDMIPFMEEDGSYEENVSCGYTSILEDGEDSFYLVYSDFTTLNEAGEQRKSIWCRRITVNKK